LGNRVKAVRQNLIVRARNGTGEREKGGNLRHLNLLINSHSFCKRGFFYESQVQVDRAYEIRVFKAYSSQRSALHYYKYSIADN
jgi:hypothetical protein